MISDEDYKSWLKDNNAIRNVLIELNVNDNSVERTLFLSKLNYTDGEVKYLPVASGGISFTEDAGVEGTTSISFGNFEMDNTNGEFDYAYNYIFRNRRVLVLVGDVRWPRTEYRVILDGIINDIMGGTQDRIIINLLDKQQRINTPLSEAILGGSTSNKDALIPVTLGECCNVTPLLTNPGTLEYQVHPLSIQDIIEVRDNGIPVAFTKYLSTGKFTINTKPIGTLTCSVQGHNVGGYSDNIAGIIKHVVKDNGKPLVAFTDDDIDLVNFNAFETAHPDPVGYYVTNRDNILSVIETLADSIGARVYISRLGKLKIFQLNNISGAASRVLTSADWEPKSFTIDSILQVKNGCKLGYCKNWTTEELKTAIPPDHKQLFATEYPLTVSSKNVSNAALYLDHTTPSEKYTLLLDSDDAQAEADRLTSFNSTKHTIYTFNGLTTCMDLEIGQLVTVKHNRYGFDDGVVAQITKLSFDWFNFKVQVWLMV